MAARTSSNNNSITVILGLGGPGSGNSDLTAIGERRRQIQELEDDYDQRSFVESAAVASNQDPSRSLTSKRVKYFHSALRVSDTSFPTGLGSPVTNKSPSASSSSPSALTVSCRQNLAPAKMTTHSHEADCEPLHEKYKREWRAWCASKNYHDGDRVTPGKMAAYTDELLDENDPQIRYDLYSRLTSIKHNFPEQHVVFETPTDFYEAFLRSDPTGTGKTVRPGNDNLVLFPTTSQTSTARSPPTTTDSSSYRPYGTDPKVIQRIEEIQSGMEAMSKRFLTELASAQTSITEQLTARLGATRAAVCEQVSVESASLRASVEGLQLRIAEIEQSTRGPWANSTSARTAESMRDYQQQEKEEVDACKSSSRELQSFQDSDLRRDVKQGKEKNDDEDEFDKLSGNQGKPEAALAQNVVVQESVENQDGNGPPSLVLAQPLRLGAISMDQAAVGVGGQMVMSEPYVPEAISKVMTTEQAMNEAAGQVVMSEPCVPKARARRSLEKRAADVSMEWSYNRFVNLTTTMESGQAKLVPLATNARLKKSVSVPTKSTFSIDVAADQNIKAQVDGATTLSLKRQDEEEVCRDPSHSPSAPTEAALTDTETLLDQNPRLHDEVATSRTNGGGEGWRRDYVHGQSNNAPTYYDLIPARSAMEELSGRSANSAVFSPLAPTSQSLTALNSSNTDADKRPRDIEPNIIQEVSEIKSMPASMSSRPANELELTTSTLVEQFSAELTMARTSMKEQLSAEFETARNSMSSQFSAGLEATRVTMISQFSARLEASLAGFGTKYFAELESREVSMRNEFLAAVEARHVAMKDQLSAELEAKRETMSKQLAIELEATRASMSEKISTELAVVPESVSNQVSARIEETLVNMSEQLSTGFETALEDMGGTVSEAIVSTQASVDGVHSRMGEIERSIRGLWTTMAAERVEPWRALQDANDVHGKRPRRD